MDAEGAVWYATVPNTRCVRVSEGGEVLQTIDLDRGCFACMLGGADRQTLFLVTREWHGMDITKGNGTGQLLSLAARRPAPAGQRRDCAEGRVRVSGCRTRVTLT